VVGDVPLPETSLRALETASAPVGAVHSERNFSNIYETNVRFVWRVLRGMGVSDAHVDDAVQDVFIVVHRRLSEFDGRHSIKSWLFAIALRVAHEHRRKIKRLGSHEPVDERLSDARPGPDEAAEQLQALRVLEALLDQLDDEKRAILVLSEMEGMTVPEIAAVTGIPLNTAYTRLRRARLQLNDALSAWRRTTR
jgi:RNA polymerase sigma-70 factor, ECF subfamily